MEVTIDEIVGKLNESPMYNLSLSSKELFHSNFLYWLGQNKETKYIFEYVIQKLSDNDKFVLSDKKKIEREKNNFDLSVEYKNGDKEVVEILIENKVKSFPSLKQLKEYQAKVANQKEKCSFILLSLFKTDKKIKPWIKKSYADLAIALTEASIDSDSQAVTPYFREIIQDYISFINNLHEISKLTTLSLNESYAFKHIKENKNDEKSIYRKFASIRFEDFYLKAKYAQIAEEISNRLGKVVQDANIFDIMANKDPKNIIFVNHGFTRADGFVEVKIKAHDFVYLIQLQDDFYRRGFENNPKDSRQMPPKITNKELDWVNFKDISSELEKSAGEKLQVYPKKSEKKDEYNKYGGHFKYKSIKISDLGDKIIQEIVDMIVKDTKQCLKFIKN